MISKQFCHSRINSNCKMSKETDFFLLNRNTKKQLIFTDYEKEKKSLIPFSRQHKCSLNGWSSEVYTHQPVSITFSTKDLFHSYTSLLACSSNYVDMAWKFRFLLLTFFFQLISLWSVRLPEYTPLILGMTSGSLSLTSISWKENKQADEWGNTEWDWEWVRQRRDKKNKKNY